MNERNTTSRYLRTGTLVGVAAIILMVFIFFIGSEQRLFSRKNAYRIEFDSVSGLAEGNPVRLSGVNVGAVQSIFLPRDPKQEGVKIEIAVEKRYAERIRMDSRARMKKLGLLAGDSYVEITPGSPDQKILPPGSLIPSAKQTNVDALVASGEELADNMVEISVSLRNILSRVDKGEGLIGELTHSAESRQNITETILVTLNRTNAMLRQIESGQGLAGKLIYDEEYANQLTGSLRSSMASLEAITGNVQTSFETNTGALPMLLNDPAGRERVAALLENMQLTTQRLAAFSAVLETGEGLVPRLLGDKEYADETLREFSALVKQLSETARKLNEGEGTAGKLISDPAIYESINDILIGINESRMLRWLVRNRQEAGIETRYNAAQGAGPVPAAAPTPTPAAAPTSVPEPTALQSLEALEAADDLPDVPPPDPTPSPTP